MAFRRARPFRRSFRRFSFRRPPPAVIRDSFVNSTVGLEAVATPPTQLFQSLVERDDWQVSTSETVQRIAVMKAFRCSYTFNLQNLLTGAIYSTHANFYWALFVASLSDPDLGLNIANYWSVGGAFAKGTGVRLLRHGTMGFTWASSATQGIYNSGPVTLNLAWKGGVKFGYDDGLFWLVQKVAPTGDQSAQGLLMASGHSQAHVRVRQ